MENIENCIYLIALFLFEILLFLYAWQKFDKSIFSPSIYTIGVLGFGTLLNIYCVDYWDINFHPRTFGIIALGLCMMVIAEKNAYIKRRNDSEYKIFYISLPHMLVISVATYCIFATFLYFNEIRRLGLAQSLAVSEAIGNIKENFEEFEELFSPFIRQGYKMVMAIAYCFTYVFVNNYCIFKKKFLKCFWLIIPLICSFGINILSGGRGDMIKMFLLFLFFYYINLWQATGWRKKPTKKLLKIGIPILGIMLSIFFFSRLVVKQNIATQKQIGGPIEYLAYYIGSPIQVLNIHVYELEKREGANKNMTLGINTFNGFYQMLKKYDILDAKQIKGPTVGAGMIYIGGDSNAAGNVETIFAPAHLDFSIAGMCVYIYILYYLISYYFYRNIMYESFSRRYVKRIILFSFFYYIVEMSFYDDCQKWVLCQTGILQFICLLLLVKFIFREKYFVQES